jgi:hypothetical protein
MSMIMPAGAEEYSWLPKGAKAADEKIGLAAISTDDLRKLAQPDFGGSDEEDGDVDGDGDVDVDDALAEEGEPSDEVDVEVDFEGEEEVGAGDPVEALEGIKEEIEVVIEDLGGGEAEGDELGGDLGEMGDEGPVDDLEVGIEVVEPLGPAGPEGLIDDDPAAMGGKSVPCATCGGSGCMASSEDGEITTAESAHGLISIAKLSGENRSILRNFWVGMLGYPKDYVDLMLKDHN